MTPTAKLLCGDCLDIMQTLPENSVDSVVTDPPYHFTSIVKRFGKNGAAPAQFGTDGAFARSSRGFMGKEWDGGDIAFRPETWAHVLRVLKPGGHLLAFGSSKGFHRMAVAIEDAGFEIRDTIMWLYGTGFPKSLDVSKAIDKSRKEDVEPTRAVCRFVRAAMDVRGLKSKDLTHHFGDCNPRLIDHWAARDTDSQPFLPTMAQWMKLRDVLGLDSSMDVEVTRLNMRKGEHGDAWNSAEIVGQYDGVPGGLGGDRFTFRDSSIRSASEMAAEWEGWGTALKPAFEPVIMARKELDGTVAANVMEWGVGGINIDGCRVETKEVRPKDSVQLAHDEFGTFCEKAGRARSTGSGANHELGRFPANVIHDGSDEVLAAFPDARGAMAPVRGTEPSGKTVNTFGTFNGRAPSDQRDGGGSAARFFYCAKATKAERAGSKHPTVKPIDLMRYLCRLVTPPGGTVLDIFAGSGTTGQAALAEGFNAMLIEREAEYQADIRRRLGLTPSFAEFLAAQPKPVPSLAEFLTSACDAS